jgi:uncharacterized protein YjiS (DUF1127 family)
MKDGKIGHGNVYASWPTPASKPAHRKSAGENFCVADQLWQGTHTFFAGCLSTLRLWQQRQRSRRELRFLLTLDDRMLADIGVNRFCVAHEARKRFWQPPGPLADRSKAFNSSRKQEERDDDLR